ncbi:hypothetical protein ASG66_21600 [Bacillus sp. Leaf406]|nr:hypothetical protein ASG66_21600 [Bacillus sp. Leaf406]
MKIHILAVTPAYNKFCIAGMTEDGEWVRPIPGHGLNRFWTEEELNFNSYGFLRPGDVLNIQGNRPTKYKFPNHTEDFLVNEYNFHKRPTNQQLITFLQGKEESQSNLTNTLKGAQRSLCLIKVDKFTHYRNDYNPEKVKPRVHLYSNILQVGNIKVENESYILKDCKWIPYVLQDNLPLNDFENIYIAIGLATKTSYDQVEYPQIIGIHTDPGLNIQSTYPY